MLVSHNPDEVRNLCDRSLMLDRGRLLHVTAPRKPAVAAHTAVGR
jgi:ABC-type multidrug transport system ATPase subunit